MADQAPGVTFSAVRLLNDAVLHHVRRDRMLAWLSGAFGAVALALAAVSLLFELTPQDPATLAAAAGLLTAGVAAGYLPTRPAAKLDPMFGEM